MQIIQDRFSLCVPEGFTRMSFQDYQQLGRTPSKDCCAILDTQRHLIMEISWKPIPLIARLMKIEKTAAITEGQIMKQVPACRKVSDISRQIAGEKACGFRYCYTASEIPMTAEYLLIKHENMYYGISWLSRQNSFDSCHQLFDDILDSVEWK